jgi:hypothetical protein
MLRREENAWPINVLWSCIGVTKVSEVLRCEGNIGPVNASGCIPDVSVTMLESKNCSKAMRHTTVVSLVGARSSGGGMSTYEWMVRGSAREEFEYIFTSVSVRIHTASGKTVRIGGWLFHVVESVYDGKVASSLCQPCENHSGVLIRRVRSSSVSQSSLRLGLYRWWQRTQSYQFLGPLHPQLLGSQQGWNRRWPREWLGGLLVRIRDRDLVKMK